MLKATNITKTIDGREILKGISLSLESGEIVSVIGPSGSGKTTLLRAISLIDSPNSGSLTIGENDYKFPVPQAENLKLPYPKLTVVFQQLFIWPHLTIRENISLPLKGKIDAKYFDEVVGLFQMNSFVDRYPNEVSIGQRQRAALVRALLLKPKFLLLDEVTSALDIEQSHLILGHLKSIAEKGVGIIFVSHALHFASKISSKVIFLDEGKVVEEGTGDILTNPKTERLKKFISISKEVIDPPPKKGIPNPARIHSPDPFLRAGNSPRFCENPNPQKIVFAKPSPHFAPPHCPNTWRAEPQKEKCPFHFRKNPPPRKSEKQGTFFLFGVAELSEAVAGLSWSVRFNLEPPRAPRVAHHLF